MLFDVRAICNPDDSPYSNWLVPTSDIEKIEHPTPNNAYIDPKGIVYVLDHELEKLIPINEASSYTLPVATTKTLGGILVGNNLVIDKKGKLDVVLPIATDTDLGAVKVGQNLVVSEDGVLSARPAISSFVNENDVLVILFSTSPTSGLYKLDLTNKATDVTTSYDLDNKEFYYELQDKTALYGIRVWRDKVSFYENVVKSNKSNVSLPIATADVIGGVKVGGGLIADVNGVLSAKNSFNVYVDQNGIIQMVLDRIPNGGEFQTRITEMETNKITTRAMPNRTANYAMGKNTSLYKVELLQNNVNVYTTMVSTWLYSPLDTDVTKQESSFVTSSNGNMAYFETSKQLNLVVFNLDLTIKGNFNGNDDVFPAGTINEEYRPAEDKLVTLHNDTMNAQAYIKSNGGITISCQNPTPQALSVQTNYTYFV
ncbi:hypothetical protein [Enterococcus alishanensis]